MGEGLLEDRVHALLEPCVLRERENEGRRGGARGRKEE